MYASFSFNDDPWLIDDSLYIISVDVLQVMLKSGASFQDLQAETPFILGIKCATKIIRFFLCSKCGIS